MNVYPMSNVYSEAKPSAGSNGRNWLWRLTDKIRHLLGSSRRLNGRSGKQFVRTLSANFKQLKQGERLASNQIIADEIDATLDRYSEDRTVNWASNDVWIDAYRVERLLINLYEADQVQIELKRRIATASELKLGFAEFYIKTALIPEQGKPLSPEQVDANRTLLGYLIDDLQWYYNRLYLKREYANRAQRRVALTFIVALLIFMVVMIAHFDPRNIAYKTTEAGAKPPAENAETGG